MGAVLAALAACALTQSPGAEVEVLEVVLDEASDRREELGPVVLRSIGAEEKSAIYVSASSDAFDPILVVEEEHGEERARDLDSGAGTTARLALDAPAGSGFQLIVASQSGEGQGPLTLRIASVPYANGELAEHIGELRARLATIESVVAGGGHSAVTVGELDEVTNELLQILGEGAVEDGVDSIRIALDLANPLAADRSGRAAGEWLIRHDASIFHAGDPQWARTANALGYHLLNLREGTHAEEVFREVYRARRTSLREDLIGLRTTALNLAISLELQFLLPEAIAVLEEFSAELRGSGEGSDEFLLPVDTQLANDYLRAGRVDDARTEFQRLFEASSAMSDPPVNELLFILNGLGTIHRLEGDLDESLRIQAEGLAMLESAGLAADDPRVVTLRFNYSSLLAELGRHQEALALLEELSPVIQSIHPHGSRERLQAEMNRANLQFLHGRYDRAEASFEDILGLAEDALPADDSVRLQCANNLATVLQVQGREAEARDLLERVQQILVGKYRASNTRVLKGWVNLSTACGRCGDLERARLICDQVLNDSSPTRSTHRTLRIDARQNLAVIAATQGRHEDSIRLVEALLGDLEELEGRDSRRALILRSGLASSQGHLRRYDDAFSEFESILTAYGDDLAPWHPAITDVRIDRAELRRRAGDGELALQELRECVQLLEEHVGPSERSTLRARHNLILAVLDQGLDPSREVGDQIAALRSFLGRASLEHAPREAEAFVSALRPMMDEVVRIAVASDAASDLRRASLDLVESVRGVALVGARLAELVADDPDLDRLRGELVRANDAFVRALASDEPEDLRDRILERERAHREMLQSVERAGLDATLVSSVVTSRVAAGLAADEACVSYWRYESSADDGHRYVAAIVRRDGEAWVELGPADRIEVAVEAWRSAAQDDSADAETLVVAAGTGVRELVLDPLDDALRGATRLHLVLDDALHAVAFDALPSAGSADALLAEAVDVRVHMSLWELLLELPPADGESIVVVGDVDYDARAEAVESEGPRAREAPFSRLLRSGDELAAVSAAFEREFETAPVTLAGEAATKDQLLAHASEARFLHVATHAYFGGEEPRDEIGSGRGAQFPGPLRRDGSSRVGGLAPMALCGLAFAGANVAGTDAILTGEQVSGLDLGGAELVVLSACETSLGLRTSGQGVGSLQKAFHVAGARSTLTSLWKVNDDRTVEFMQDFYERMWAEDLPASEALRQTKLDWYAEYQPYRHWAGWVLTSAD